MGQPNSTNKKPAINIEHFVTYLNSIKTKSGMDCEVIDAASNVMNAIIKNALLKTDIQPNEKRQLVLAYMEVWGTKPGLNKRSVNLAGINLSGADLSGVNLARVNLSEANLAMANLKMANMERTNLKMANLLFADLHGAFLAGANLSGANLAGANLTMAKLKIYDTARIEMWWPYTTDFTRVEMYGVNLTYSILLANYLWSANNLPDKSKSKAICSTGQLADVINYILAIRDSAITEDQIRIMPNLYKAAKYVGEHNIKEFRAGNKITVFAKSNDCKVAAEALYQKFPFLSSPERLQMEAKSQLRGYEQKRSNFLAAVTFLEGTNQQGSILNDLSTELRTKIISEVIAGTACKTEEPNEIHSNIARILVSEVKNKSFSAAEAAHPGNLANSSERNILDRIIKEIREEQRRV